jgi:hypothetical protein
MDVDMPGTNVDKIKVELVAAKVKGVLHELKEPRNCLIGQWGDI